ncbi:hypothetical protein [Flavobacterium tibetense]|nr:hypothetical protein [Flavobacterium tibetense]
MIANKMTLKNKCTLVILFSVAISYAQTNLPVERTTWNTTPLGWTDWGTAANTTNSDKSLNLGKLENAGDYYEVVFNNVPNKVTFQIKGDSFNGGTFSLQESKDGVYWSNVKVYKSLPVNEDTQKFSLKNNTRYVRFYYTNKENGSIAIDNVEITADTQSNPHINSIGNGRPKHNPSPSQILSRS